MDHQDPSQASGADSSVETEGPAPSPRSPRLRSWLIAALLAGSGPAVAEPLPELPVIEVTPVYMDRCLRDPEGPPTGICRGRDVEPPKALAPNGEVLAPIDWGDPVGLQPGDVDGAKHTLVQSDALEADPTITDLKALVDSPTATVGELRRQLWKPLDSTSPDVEKVRQDLISRIDVADTEPVTSYPFAQYLEAAILSVRDQESAGPAPDDEAAGPPDEELGATLHAYVATELDAKARQALPPARAILIKNNVALPITPGDLKEGFGIVEYDEGAQAWQVVTRHGATPLAADQAYPFVTTLSGDTLVRVWMDDSSDAHARIMNSLIDSRTPLQARMEGELKLDGTTKKLRYRSSASEPPDDSELQFTFAPAPDDQPANVWNGLVTYVDGVATPL
jgi:hypothetical protein